MLLWVGLPTPESAFPVGDPQTHFLTPLCDIMHTHTRKFSSIGLILFLVYCNKFLRSVVCRLSRSCTLLKPLDGFTSHLAGTLVGSSDTLC